MTEQCYRVSTVSGKFDHVIGNEASLNKGRELSGAPVDASEDELSKHWGVTIEPVSDEDRSSIGL